MEYIVDGAQVQVHHDVATVLTAQEVIDHSDKIVIAQTHSRGAITNLHVS